MVSAGGLKDILKIRFIKKLQQDHKGEDRWEEQYTWKTS